MVRPVLCCESPGALPVDSTLSLDCLFWAASLDGVFWAAANPIERTVVKRVSAMRMDLLRKARAYVKASARIFVPQIGMRPVHAPALAELFETTGQLIE